MNRQEFLQELYTALQGNVSQAALNENLQYYEDYIIGEARKGKSEEQVIVELGNPRLIAKTLIATAEQFGEKEAEGYSSTGYTQETGEDRKGFHVNYSEQDGWNVGIGKFKLNSPYGKLVIILLAVLVIVLAAKVVAFLLPIVIPVVLVCLIVSLIFGGRR